MLFEDLKYRAISWYYFPAMLALLIMTGLSQAELYPYGSTVLINLVILSFLLLSSYTYLAIAKRHRQSWSQFIGLGDVLFFVVIAFGFSTTFFLVFMNVTLVASILLGVFIFNKVGKNVPLAGIQAAFMAVCYLVLFNLGRSPFNESPIVF